MAFDPGEPFNLADYLLGARIREGLGERVAVLTDDARFTYAQVDALADRAGSVLRELGVRQEERVLVALADGIEFVACIFGILRIGAVLVMVNPDASANDLGWFLAYSRARVAIVEPAVQARMASLPAPHLLHTVVVGAGAGEATRFETLMAAAPDRLAPAHTHPDDPAIWLFSGGTTGHPKGVVLPHRAFANTTECYAKGVLGYGPEDRTLAVPKLFFGYATGSALFFPFSVGASTVLFRDRATPEALFARIARHRPTLLITVPTLVNRMVSHPDAAQQDLSCLRLATSAGEALPVELYERWKATFGVELLDGLGTAEMWHIFLTNRPDRVEPGTLGWPVPGFDVAVCDAGGQPVPDGEVGALWVRGGSRALGYWQNLEKTQSTFRGEWVVTGDLVQRLPSGAIRYGGRADDMLKVAGRWVSPQEVENCLLQHPAVRECAVVGAPDCHGLIKPHAFVVAAVAEAEVDGEAGAAEAAEADAELAATLQAHVHDRLAPYKTPASVVRLDSLPQTHLGKVDRAELRRRAAGGSSPKT